MARAYSVDLRERVVRAVAGSLSRRAAAARFEVSVSFVIKLMQRWRRRGTVQPIGSAAGNGPRWRRTPSGCVLWWRQSPTLRSPTCRAGWKPGGSR
jgi:transposase